MVYILPFVGEKTFVQFMGGIRSWLDLAPAVVQSAPGLSRVYRDVLHPASTAAEEGGREAWQGPSKTHNPS